MEMVLDAWDAEGGGEDRDLFDRIPAGLQTYIEQRLSLLSDEERAVLETASVVGSQFAVAAIAPALERDTEGIEAACDSLAKVGKFIKLAGSIEWPDGTVSDSYGFLHDLYQEVLYRGITSTRQSRLHKQIGQTLEKSYEDSVVEHATEVAVHFVRGRVPDKASLYLRLAGEQALRRSADQEATTHLGQALEFLARLEAGAERDKEEVLLRLELASSLVPRRGWMDAEVEYCYRRALELAEALGDEDYVSAALFAKATMHEVRGEYQRAGELMTHRMNLPMISSLTASPQAPLESCELLACSEFHRGLFKDALVHAEEGIDLDRPDTHGGLATMGESPGVGCYDWAGLSSWFLGHTGQASSRVEEALELAERPGNEYSRTLARTQAAVLYQLRGDAESTMRWAEAAIDSAGEFGYAHRAAWGGILLGWARAMLGEPGPGISAIEAGMETSLRTGARMDHAYYQALLADAFRQAGELTAGLDAINEALDSIRRERSFFYEAEMLRLKGLIVTERDGESSVEAARSCFEEAVRVAREQGAKPLALRAAMELVRFSRSKAGVKQAREILRDQVLWCQKDFDLPELEEARALLTTEEWSSGS